MSRSPDARSLALTILETLERREAFADAVLDAVLSRHPGMAPRDRALVGQLVYGVLRWRNRIDAHIARASSRPLRRIHPTVLEILRLGVFQILFLDRVPARAAVHQAVEEARRRGQAHAAGFVNAVLRTVARQGPELPLPRDPVGRLSLLFGCPGWVVEAWVREHGEAGAEALCRAASRVPPLWLRVSTARVGRDEAVRRLRAEGIPAQPGRFAPEAVLVEVRGDPRAVSLIREGLAVIQDQASQLVAHLLAPEPGWRVLDACAAPGLKATHLAEGVGPAGRVTAVDVHPHRARQVAALARRLALGNVDVAAADATRPPCRARFDAVLVDAPCSGLGVLSRTPEAKWRRTPEHVAGLPDLQLRLLRAAAGLVRPGGVLVYATCTTLRAENQGVVERFLEEAPGFAPEPPPPGPVPWPDLMDDEGYYRTFPRAVAGEGPAALDGFFGARLRRREGS